MNGKVDLQIINSIIINECKVEYKLFNIIINVHVKLNTNWTHIMDPCR